MIESIEGEPNAYTIYYNILDGDQNGLAPDCKYFNKAEDSCISKIAASNNKVYNNYHFGAVQD